MNHSKIILLAGGTGLIGRKLAKIFRAKGYEVRVMTRHPKGHDTYASFGWDLDEMRMEAAALKDIDVIINLAGEGIANKRWTTQQKKKIIDTRVLSTKLLFDTVQSTQEIPAAFIAASGIGYYGMVTQSQPFVESDEPGKDYLGKTCVDWEAASLQFESIGIRTVILRTGVVLAKEGGALPKMTMTKKFGFLNALGSGKQYFPWIHIEDLVAIYQFALEHDKMTGIYNAVAPAMDTQNEFIDAIVKQGKGVWRLPNVPAFLMKALMGEMSGLVLKGSPASCDKLLDAGYQFKYSDVADAVEDLV